MRRPLLSEEILHKKTSRKIRRFFSFIPELFHHYYGKIPSSA